MTKIPFTTLLAVAVMLTIAGCAATTATPAASSDGSTPTALTIKNVAGVGLYDDQATSNASNLSGVMTFRFWEEKGALAGEIVSGGERQAVYGKNPVGKLLFVKVDGTRITFESPTKAQYDFRLNADGTITGTSWAVMPWGGRASVSHTLTPQH